MNYRKLQTLRKCKVMVSAHKRVSSQYMVFGFHVVGVWAVMCCSFDRNIPMSFFPCCPNND